MFINYFSRFDVIHLTGRVIQYIRSNGTSDFGVDVVSGNILTLLLASLKPGGAVACSWLVGGPSFESSIFPFILRGNALLGVDSVEISIEKKLEVWENFATDWKLDLSSLVKEVKLEGLEDEISKILTGGQVGRVVVDLN